MARAIRAHVSRALGTPVVIGDAEILPLVEHESAAVVRCGRLAWHGERRPIGVVVRRAGAARAFLIDGGERDPATLVADFPALAAWLG
jgi:hypothetical protein